MENFINKATHKFSNFDYNDVVINNKRKDKVIITCNIHNIKFKITPDNHLRSLHGGCTQCKFNQYKIKLLENEILNGVKLDEYEASYWISNFGRCFSKKTNKLINNRESGGYYKINLRNKNQISKAFFIHYLVYISFNNDYDSKKIIDHIDGNKLNNNVINLRCVSASENVRNAYKNNDKMYQQKIIQAFDNDNNLIKEFNTSDDARKFINQKNKSGIANALRGIYNTAGGYKWKYKENNNETKNVDDISEFTSIGIVNDKDLSNYAINKKGIIINTKYNNRIVKQFVNESKYKNVYLYYESKKKIVLFVHRILGKIFLKNGNKYYNDNNYVINHKDKNRVNNNLDNLEWVTQKENTIHGCARKIIQIDKDTNKTIKIYNTIRDAYKELGKPWNSLICKVCSCEKGRKTIYGFKWKYVV